MLWLLRLSVRWRKLIANLVQKKKPLPKQGFCSLVAREGIEPPTLRI